MPCHFIDLGAFSSSAPTSQQVEDASFQMEEGNNTYAPVPYSLEIGIQDDRYTQHGLGGVKAGVRQYYYI